MKKLHGTTNGQTAPRVRALGFCLPIFLAACGLVSNPADQGVSTGSVSMALTATASDGTQYRLHSATFVIAGPTATQLVTSDAANETVLTAVLNVGSYTSTLQNGWVLQRLDGATFVPVEATLISANPASFQITDGGTTNLVYQFSTNGTIITVGKGTLNISIQVTETGGNATCTPLGAGCAAGAWCAPGSIVGGNPQCVSNGPLAIGAPCDGTVGCVANAVCGDIGNGNVCIELCPIERVGQLCASGNICTNAGLVDVAACF